MFLVTSLNVLQTQGDAFLGDFGNTGGFQPPPLNLNLGIGEETSEPAFPKLPDVSANGNTNNAQINPIIPNINADIGTGGHKPNSGSDKPIKPQFNIDFGTGGHKPNSGSIPPIKPQNNTDIGTEGFQLNDGSIPPIIPHNNTSVGTGGFQLNGGSIPDMSSFSAPTRLNLLHFKVNPGILDTGAQSVQSLFDTQKEVDEGSLESNDVTEDLVPLVLESLDGAITDSSDRCRPRQTGACSNSPYRTMNGECNNIDNPSWGSAATHLIRVQPSTYLDGVFRARNMSRLGKPLPSPRVVSTSCTSTGDSSPSSAFTLTVMQMGQFMDHDIVHVPIMRPSSGSGLECCSNQREFVNSPFCLPISIPSNDRLYGISRIQCMNFVRSIPIAQLQCPNRAAQQINQVTHFIDGSNVYGSSEEKLRDLRIRGSFLMRTSRGNRLPRLPQHVTGCRLTRKFDHCFEAGDLRVNEQPSLTLMHVIWLRLHNIIAEALKSLNEGVLNEEIFQETRAIIVALMQKIYYDEWLPIILGRSMIRRMQLDGPVSFNPNINPSIVNEFSTAAFRFGHSLISGQMRLFTERGRPRRKSFRLSNSFFQPGPVLQVDERKMGLMMGMCHQPMQRMDTTFTEDVAGQLFRGGDKLGLDLVSLNIQRGRDHGIGSYNQTRQRYSSVCPGLSEVRDWAGLHSVLPSREVGLLRVIYQSVGDIDLFVGGVMERPQNGALVGPTFACIIADQFARLKHGDRHFYNHHDSMFSRSQLRAIDSMTWAHILCLTNKIRSIPRNPFRVPQRSNRHISCTGMNLMDLAPWARFLPRR